MLCTTEGVNMSGFPVLDSGAMGSYVFFYMLGLYPLPATRQFLISSPYFKQVKIRNPFLDSTTTINALGFEGNPTNGTGGNIYVKVCRPFTVAGFS